MNYWNNDNINKKLCINFCQYYHSVWDNNFEHVNKLFNKQTQVNYCGRNFDSFNSLLNYIKYNQNINEFEHTMINNMIWQSLDNNKFLINISGFLKPKILKQLKKN